MLFLYTILQQYFSHREYLFINLLHKSLFYTTIHILNINIIMFTLINYCIKGPQKLKIQIKVFSVSFSNIIKCI